MLYSRLYKLLSKIKIFGFCKFSAAYIYLWLCLEETILVLGTSLCNALEIIILYFGNISAGDINLCGSRLHVRLIYAFEGHTVELVWASYKQQSRFQLFQKHYTLAAETSGQQNQYAAWLY